MKRDLIPVARALKRNVSIESWESVPDPRDVRGRRYELSTLLRALVLGLMANVWTLRDVERLLQQTPARRALGIRGTPSDTALYNLLVRLDPDGLRPVVRAQIKAMERNKQLESVLAFPWSLVVIDGKSLGTDEARLHPESHRQTTEAGFRYQTKILRAVHASSAVKPVLDQRLIPKGKGERHDLLSFVTDLRKNFPSLATCLSFDAGFWSLDFVTTLSVFFIRYIIALRGNAGSPHLFAVKALGSGNKEPEKGWELEQRETLSKSTYVVRQIARSHDDLGTCGAVQTVWRQRKRTYVNGKRTEQEDRYFATNLPLNQLTPSQALEAIRAHWAIENDSNWTMDVILNEDTHVWAAQKRAREVLSWLRILAYNLLRLLRCRTLRSQGNKLLPWRALLEEVRDTLMRPDVWASGFS